jgi:translation initiation factor IF-3
LAISNLSDFSQVDVPAQICYHAKLECRVERSFFVTHPHPTKIGVRRVEKRSEGRIISDRENRINQQIRAREVRLIDENGHHVGIVPLSEALDRAQQADLDLVEVSPNAEPPVAKVMDYGKFLYEKAKREREARKAQKQIEVKEIRLRPKTSEHHKAFKVRNARRWLEDGMKVKARIRFRGREYHYPEIAQELLQSIADELSDVGVVEQRPSMEGRTMLMVLAPKKGD